MKTSSPVCSSFHSGGTQKKDQGKREIPILFFQAGDARHLPYTFSQARYWAKDGPVILLGDSSNRHYRGLDHVPIRDFASGVPRLRQTYVHYSSNAEEFEFFSLARWLVVEEFARKQGLREFLYLDSDVLIFDNPGKIAQGIPECGITLGWSGELDSPGAVACAGVCLTRDLSLLQKLCSNIYEFYEDPEKLTQGKAEVAAEVERKHGGISDMWFLVRFARENLSSIHNCWQPEIDGVIDLNISNADGFRRLGGVKEIQFRERIPYGFSEKKNRWIRFAALHFGGHNKKQMKKYLGRSGGLPLVAARLRERIGKCLGWHRPAGELKAFFY